jgi:hypothetical protein
MISSLGAISITWCPPKALRSRQDTFREVGSTWKRFFCALRQPVFRYLLWLVVQKKCWSIRICCWSMAIQIDPKTDLQNGYIQIHLWVPCPTWICQEKYDTQKSHRLSCSDRMGYWNIGVHRSIYGQFGLKSYGFLESHMVNPIKIPLNHHFQWVTPL